MANSIDVNLIPNAVAWLYDVFWLSGITGGKPCKRPSDYYGITAFENVTKDDAKKVVRLITDRPVGYKQMQEADRILAKFAGEGFCPTLVYSEPESAEDRIFYSLDDCARAVAYFTETYKYYWDDTKITPYEMDEIRKTTLGQKLWESHCFISQERSADIKDVASTNSAALAAAPKTTQSSAQSPAQPSTNQPGQPVQSKQPQNNYKSLGGLSGKIPNLIGGQPGAKHVFNVQSMYCILGDKAGKNTPFIFITPIDDNGRPVSKEKAETVKLGSAHGYSSCVLFWSARASADQFFTKLMASAKSLNSKFQNLRVAAAKTDPNGYFMVSTDYGDAFIKAIKLNEDLDITEDTLSEHRIDVDLDEAKKAGKKKKKRKKGRGYSIKDIDVYGAAFDKYRD